MHPRMRQTSSSCCFHYNWHGIECFDITSDQPLPTGKATIEFQFAYDGGKPGSGETGTLLINGQKVGEGRIEKTVPNKLQETAEVGWDLQTPVTEAYSSPFKFTGTLGTVVIELK